MQLSIGKWFKKTPASILGVDLGSSVIKIVELSPAGQQFKLESYALAKIEVGKETKRNIKELAEILKESLTRANIKSAGAYIAVPESSSFSVLIDLPIMPEKEIDLAMPYEAKKYIPVPVDRVYLQWFVVPSVAAANVETNTLQPPAPAKDKIQVLLVAVMKDMIDNLTQVGQMAGLDVLGLETESFSLIRALIGQDARSLLFLDIGTHSFNIDVVDGGFLRLSYEQELAILQERDKPELQKNIIDGIIKEVQRTTNLYFNKSGKKVEKCVLAGGGSFIGNLLEALKIATGIEILRGDPFSDIIYSSVLKPAIAEIGPSMAVAVGLAKRPVK